LGTNQKISKVITARNPFRKDDEVVDYDMDSEDEWAEENGEDLENKKDEEEDDEMEEEA
jgi:chromatin assembly factor 1 subunit A